MPFSCLSGEDCPRVCFHADDDDGDDDDDDDVGDDDITNNVELK